jgi:FkbH-like protein
VGDNVLDSIKSSVAAGEVPARRVLVELADTTDPMTHRQAGRAFKKLDAAGLRAVNVGLLATSTAGPLDLMLRSALVTGGMLPTFTAGEYGAFEMQLAQADPAVFAGQDAVLLLLDDAYFLPKDWTGDDVPGLVGYLADRVEQLATLVKQAAERTGTTLLLHTVPLSSTVRDTVLSWRDRAVLDRGWARLNLALLELADVQGVAVADFVAELAESGVPARDDRLKQYADIAYTDGALMVLARSVRRFLQAKTGQSRKVLALDLDNTLWGGVLGEVGAAGVELGGLYPGKSFKELQKAVLRLRDQGVILALASKNDADHVDASLTEHPEVLLKPEVFSATAVNWQPKALNLKGMAQQLDLGINSFVFMDDSPFERGHVAEEAPEVTVISSEGDPAYLVRTLVSGGWFDTVELTDTDRKRPAMYKARAERGEFAGSFGSSEDYLAALDMNVTIAVATEFEVPRIAQMAARTNQFNLTGIRYSQPETAQLVEDPDHLVISWAVKDRFGDEGIVGAAWVDRSAPTWKVLNFVMSCRVLGRGVELSVIGWLVRQAKAAGASALEGRFTPSARNTVSSEMWVKAGFPQTGQEDQTQVYTLELGDVADLVPSWIKLEER